MSHSPTYCKMKGLRSCCSFLIVLCLWIAVCVLMINKIQNPGWERCSWGIMYKQITYVQRNYGWRNVSCRKMSARMKEEVCGEMIRLGLETVMLRRRQKAEQEVVEMKMWGRWRKMSHCGDPKGKSWKSTGWRWRSEVKLSNKWML